MKLFKSIAILLVLGLLISGCKRETPASEKTTEPKETQETSWKNTAEGEIYQWEDAVTFELTESFDKIDAQTIAIFLRGTYSKGPGLCEGTYEIIELSYAMEPLDISIRKDIKMVSVNRELGTMIFLHEVSKVKFKTLYYYWEFKGRTYEIREVAFIAENGATMEITDSGLLDVHN